jgi:group I intron endonuclease
MTDNSGIYLIKNIINEYKYVGSAVNIRKRRNRHLSDLRKNKHHSKYLQRAWNKYGEENFIFEVIEEVIDKSSLTEREQYYLDILNPEYNLEKTAYSSLGIKRSKEYIKKLSERIITDEWRKKMRESHLGKKHSDETKKKMSLSHKGKIRSEEHRKNLSLSLKGKSYKSKGKKKKPLSEEQKAKMSLSLKGRKAWNKGIKTGPQSKKTKENKRKARLAYLERIKNIVFEE